MRKIVILLNAFCIVSAFAGCGRDAGNTSAAKASPTSTPNNRLIANTGIQDPKTRYIGEVSVYTLNLIDIVNELKSTFNTKKSSIIKNAIATAHEKENLEYTSIEPPPPGTDHIAVKAAKIHMDQVKIYTEYLKTFSDPNGDHVVIANARMEESLKEVRDLQTLLDQELAAAGK